MKKIVFFDIDGTLVTEDEFKIIPDSTRRALSKARENGNLLFVNTGRTRFIVGDEIRELGFDGFICGCGTYIEIGGEERFYSDLSHEFCRETAAQLRECGCIPVYERRDTLFFERMFDEHPSINLFRSVFLDSSIPTDRFSDEEDFSFDKFVIFTDENTDMLRFRELIGKNFSIIDRGGGFYENVPLGCSKATGIERVLKMYGIPIENAYAIGDSMNDLPMLKAVPNSIAMGGGEALYPYVAYVTAPILEDGIEQALAHYGII